MLKYLIEKEFKQFIRHSFLPKLVVAMPVVIMLVLPWTANFDVKNLKMAVVDLDRSPYSRELYGKAAASEYFDLTGIYGAYSEAMEGIETGKVDIILQIPQGFERDLVRENAATVMVTANTVNGVKGGLGSSYMASVVLDFSAKLRADMGIGTSSGDNTLPIIEIIPQNKFNPHMDYKLFMVPAIMVMLLTLMCCFLPALNIVSEKEIGTIEQMNVTPVPKLTFILAKLIPYWIIGFVVLSLCFLIAWIVYGIVPVGSLVTIYGVALIYVLVASGLGLVISNYSDNLQQAMFVMFFFVLIFILLSGLYTPIRSMPVWAQQLTYLNPLRYYMEIIRQVYMKGSVFTDMLPQVGALVLFAIGANAWAVFSYRKSS